MPVIPGLGTVPEQEQQGIQFIIAFDSQSQKGLREKIYAGGYGFFKLGLFPVVGPSPGKLVIAHLT